VVQVDPKPAASGSSQAEPTSLAAPSDGAPPAEGTWKVELDQHLEHWRAESAQAREKAENERARWETIRATEREQAASQNAAGFLSVEHMAPGIGARSDTTMVEPNSPRGGDFVTADPLVFPTPAEGAGIGTHAREGTDERLANSQWEHVPSQLASFPSTTFPDRSHNHTPPNEDSHHSSNTHTTPRKPEPPLSATLAIFDTTLSTRSRVSALTASLAINLLLPFVNGVMLGFGEIFAKNVVIGWLGWKLPADLPRPVIANVGLGMPKPSSEIRKR